LGLETGEWQMSDYIDRHKTKWHEVVLGILIILLLLGSVAGYVMNVIKFIQCNFASPYKEEVFRFIGFFGPGIVLGWIDLNEK
jgi:hypothetical protein